MTFRPIGDIAARVMRDTERERKLEAIRALSVEELKGWIWARGIDARPDFDGERAALAARAKVLGVRI